MVNNNFLEVSMIWTIAKKEFHLNLLTFRFVVGTILCLGLVIASTLFQIDRYTKRMDAYQAMVLKDKNELINAPYLTNTKPYIHRRPSVMEILVEGISDRFGNRIQLPGNVIAGYRIFGGEDANPFLAALPSIDFTFVIGIVISLMALLFTYDAITGEKEERMLAQLLSNPISREKLLLGKYLGTLMTLIVPLTIAFLCALLVILFSPRVDIGWVELGRTLVIFALSVILTSIFIFIGLLFS